MVAAWPALRLLECERCFFLHDATSFYFPLEEKGCSVFHTTATTTAHEHRWAVKQWHRSYINTNTTEQPYGGGQSQSRSSWRFPQPFAEGSNSAHMSRAFWVIPAGVPLIMIWHPGRLLTRSVCDPCGISSATHPGWDAAQRPEELHLSSWKVTAWRL